MKIYGYSKDETSNDSLLELEEITLQTNSDVLRKIADFIYKSADLMDKHGRDFGHEHLRDYLKNDAWNNADIILLKE